MCSRGDGWPRGRRLAGLIDEVRADGCRGTPGGGRQARGGWRRRLGGARGQPSAGRPRLCPAWRPLRRPRFLPSAASLPAPRPPPVRALAWVPAPALPPGLPAGQPCTPHPRTPAPAAEVGGSAEAARPPGRVPAPAQGPLPPRRSRSGRKDRIQSRSARAKFLGITHAVHGRSKFRTPVNILLGFIRII